VAQALHNVLGAFERDRLVCTDGKNNNIQEECPATALSCFLVTSTTTNDKFRLGESASLPRFPCGTDEGGGDERTLFEEKKKCER